MLDIIHSISDATGQTPQEYIASIQDAVKATLETTLSKQFKAPVPNGSLILPHLSKKLTLCTLNVRGLRSTGRELAAWLHHAQSTILVATETKTLPNDHKQGWFKQSCPGYLQYASSNPMAAHNHGHERGQQGVLIAVSEELRGVCTKMTVPSELEGRLVHLRVCIPGSGVLGVYQPCGDTWLTTHTFLSEYIAKQLRTARINNSRVVMGGDWNAAQQGDDRYSMVPEGAQPTGLDKAFQNMLTKLDLTSFFLTTRPHSYIRPCNTGPSPSTSRIDDWLTTITCPLIAKAHGRHQAQILADEHFTTRALATRTDHRPVQVSFAWVEVFNTMPPPPLPRLPQQPRFTLPIAQTQLQGFATDLMHYEGEVTATTTELREAIDNLDIAPQWETLSKQAQRILKLVDNSARKNCEMTKQSTTDKKNPEARRDGQLWLPRKLEQQYNTHLERSMIFGDAAEAHQHKQGTRTLCAALVSLGPSAPFSSKIRVIQMRVVMVYCLIVSVQNAIEYIWLCSVWKYW